MQPTTDCRKAQKSVSQSPDVQNTAGFIDEKVTVHSSIRVAACDKRGGGQLSPVGQALHSRRPVMRTDVYVRRLHYGLVLCKLAVICLDPSGLCLTTGVPVGSMLGL